MNDYTPGLTLAWQIAANETAHAQHEFIEPEYLFIGLCKLKDVLAPELLPEMGLREA